MKQFLFVKGKTLILVGIVISLLALFTYVAVRSGPLAPIPVTLATVEQRGITPTLFGIGTVEARYTHKIGPTFAGRLKHVDVQSGDTIKTDQLLGEMDPIDLDDRIDAQNATVKRTDASVLAAEAQVQEAVARKSFAEIQTTRYDQLFTVRSGSKEIAEAKRQEFHIAQAALLAARANLDVSRHELVRLRAERDGLVRQRVNLRLVSPVDGLVTRRDADPGTTVVAGQTVIEVVEPGSLWLNVRFDQQRALGLQAQLPAQIVLRSQAGELLDGQVARIEPVADAVTEEVLAKVAFTQPPPTLPPIGELAEITVVLAARKTTPVVLNASLQRVDGNLGVWVVDKKRLRFAPVKIGASDLNGWVQILAGLSGGEVVVAYSRKALHANSRIKVVDRIVGKSS